MAECSQWNFDIITLERLTERRPLVWLGMTILARYSTVLLYCTIGPLFPPAIRAGAEVRGSSIITLCFYMFVYETICLTVTFWLHYIWVWRRKKAREKEEVCCVVATDCA